MVRAHLGPLNNQPLTIYFVGGFFFVASLLPGFEGKVGVSKDNIGEMLGHSNSVVTEHYLASLDIEKTQEINQHIL